MDVSLLALSIKPCHSLSTSSSLGERLKVDCLFMMRQNSRIAFDDVSKELWD